MELFHIYLAVLSISFFFKYLTFYFLFSISTLYFDAALVGHVASVLGYESGPKLIEVSNLFPIQ